MNRIVRTSVVTTAVLAAALGVAGPASAAAPKSLDDAKKAVSTRIDKRLDALKKFETALDGAKQVQAGHRTTLDSLIKEQTTDLTALKGKVNGETTGAAVRTDAKAMVDDFRVFILTGPKVHLTAAIDTEQAIAGKLGTKATPIRTGLDGKVDMLLAVKPGSDGDAIRAQVKTVRDAAKSARASLKALRKKS